MELESFFDLGDCFERLNWGGGTPEILDGVVDFENFRGLLAGRLGYGGGLQGSRPPFDPVAMLRLLVLRTRNDISDSRVERMMHTRFSWLVFPSFRIGKAMSGENAIRHFCNRLTEAKTLPLVMRLFRTYPPPPLWA